MNTPVRVHLIGFTAFERSALASWFRLSGGGAPGYALCDHAADARLLIVDAEDPVALRSVLAAGRVAEAVFIGADAPPGASAWMLRPIDPVHVMRELDALCALPAPRAPAQPQALLVDDSEIALRWLETRLHRLGMITQRATSSGRAIEQLARQHWDYVFADVELGPASDLDGLALCRHIKRQPRGGREAPVVVVVSAHDSETDRARGALAGCDGYLAKPLDEAALARLLARHGHRPQTALPA